MNERARELVSALHRRIRSMRVSVGLLFIGAGLCACQSDEDRGVYGEWVMEREERGDTVVVRTITGSVWRDTMQLVPELSIGTLDGDAPYIFGDVVSLDVDSVGRVYVLDTQAREVRVFSDSGDHIRTLGRRGEGPGEFRSPVHVRVTPDGRIVVRDENAARFSVFSWDGTYLGGWPRGSTYSSWLPFYFDAEGRVLNPSMANALVRHELNGTVVDTTAIPTFGIAVPRVEVAIQGGRASFTVPFVPAEHWTVNHEGSLVRGYSGAYAFEWEGPGNRVTRVERQVDPVPVTPAEADQARESVVRNVRDSYGIPDWRWSGPDIPLVKPAYEWIIPGRDGTTWVIRSTASREEENPTWDPAHPEYGFRTSWTSATVADVFDEEGRYLGPVLIPTELRLQRPFPVLTRDAVWGLVHTEIGVPQVVLFRVAHTSGN